MDVTITRDSDIQITAEVTVPWDQVAGHYKEIMREIAKTVQIPGFRKGKAPAALIKKRYRDYILGDLAQKVVPESMAGWVKEHDVSAVGAPRLKDVSMKDHENLHYVAEVDVLPSVELKEWRGIEAESLNIAVTAEQVDEEIQNMLKAAATKEDIKDRAIEKGDSILMGLTAMDPQTMDTIEDIESYRLDLNDEAHAKWPEFLENLKAGDDCEIEDDIPGDFSIESVRDKHVKLFLEIKEVTRETQPQLDEDFAKKHDAESVDELRAKTETRVHEFMTEQERVRLENDLVGKMVSEYDMPLPPSLIEHEARNMVEMQMGGYMSMMRNDPQYEGFLQQMIQMSMPRALGKARADLVLDEIAKSLELEVGEDDIEAEIKKLAESSGQPIDQVREQVGGEGVQEGLKITIKRQKALKEVVDAAKITKVDELTQPEPPADEAAGEGGEPEVVEATLETETGELIEATPSSSSDAEAGDEAGQEETEKE